MTTKFVLPPSADDLEKIAREAGVMLTMPSIMQEAVDERTKEFRFDDDGQIRHTDGSLATEWYAAQKDRRPQWFRAVDDPQNELEYKAFVEGNISARGQLVKQNPALANERAKAFGTGGFNI